MQDIHESEILSIEGGDWKLPGWVGVVNAAYDLIKGFVEGLSDSSIPYVTSSIQYEYVESTIYYQ
ncbi:MAG: hypothetical protein E6J90_03355 [Deltaproteobacteria bacterium]|nr:MAG: hypothetical protein E6J91_52295 [Deltaproteobacteria bacterium]TMQ27019.1 MAG: hypothetical protein E6J90_03355 [Deltaproteobacteria bacterium]